MSERPTLDWNRQEAMQLLKLRSLANMSPALATYLTPGANVLDVGCGPGPITVDIAKHVHPGCVTGVDWAQAAVDQAQALAREAGLDNVTFQTGSAYELEFADATFDVTCSLNLLAHLRDPVKALIEQKRVTKPGGWILSSNGDYGGKIFYPPCPTLEKISAELIRLTREDADPYVHLFLGRRSRELFAEAGLVDAEVLAECAPRSLGYPGTETFDAVWDVLNVFLDTEGRQATLARELRRLGIVDDETVGAAREEMAAFEAHPHALYLDEVRFVAAGRVP